MLLVVLILFLFFFNDTATTEIYTLSLHDALPISGPVLMPRIASHPTIRSTGARWHSSTMPRAGPAAVATPASGIPTHQRTSSSGSVVASSVVTAQIGWRAGIGHVALPHEHASGPCSPATLGRPATGKWLASTGIPAAA